MPEPVYITKDSYYEFSGIDLDIELSGTNTDNVGDVTDIFLKRLEDWCLAYLEYKYNVKTTSDEFNLVCFKKGVLHQCDYIRINGELSIRHLNNMKLLAPNAFMEWKIGGMTNTALPMQKEQYTWV